MDAYRRILNSGGAEFTVSKGKMIFLFSSMIMYCIGLILIINVLNSKLWHTNKSTNAAYDRIIEYIDVVLLTFSEIPFAPFDGLRANGS